VKVKRYVVDSMPDALEKIRVELGKDAIILNTKPIKTGGFFGLFGKQQIEVIAAVDDKAAAKGKPDKTASLERPVVPASHQVVKQAYGRAAQPASLPNNMGSDSMDSPSPSPAIAVTATATAEPAQMQASNGSVSGSPTHPAPESSELANELRHMREIFAKFMLHDGEDRLPPSILAVRERLKQQEVEEALIAQLVQSLLQQIEQTQEMSQSDAFHLSSEWLKAQLGRGASLPARIDQSTRFAFFFGPTGVGKTTTIAKLAAESMLKDKRKIGFITSDTFRIAAVEQLKTYANILNVPLEVVFSPKEVEQAMERLNHCDLIFVDTAGRNYRQDEYVKGIKELLRFDENSIHFLVLSLTSRYADMKAIAENFRDIPDARVIFTKADETRVYGTILNILSEYPLSLSYMTTGQNVPDDIVTATPARVAKMILGDDTYA